MYHFFIQAYQVRGNTIKIEGSDVNHMKNVLRMKPGERVTVTDEDSVEYQCHIERLEEDAVWLEIENRSCVDHELCADIYLFQGLPKGDKMELIIQKSVELGVHTIVPVETKRCVVRLDEKKKAAKLKRWNAIAQSAAKQSKRTRIPQIPSIMSMEEAVRMAETFDLVCIPYEQEEGMKGLGKFLDKLHSGMKAAFFIGPEGGFEENEIEMAKQHGIYPVSLGKRILRTETAGLALMSMMMLRLECEAEEKEQEKNGNISG